MTREQLWKSKCLEEIEKNVDLKFTIEGLEEEIDKLEQSVSDWKSSYEELRYQDTLRDFFVESLEKELNELEQSVSGWKRRYEELALQHQDALMDLFDATNSETPSPMASDIPR